jgi:hypothetical protein
MKKILCLAIVMSSLSMGAFADSKATGLNLFESHTSSDGYNRGFSSSESKFSETSETSLREQINANKASVAAFIQSNDVDSQNAEVKEIVESAKALMHAEIDAMSDRDVLTRVLEK